MNDYLCEVVVALGKSLGKYALKKLLLWGRNRKGVEVISRVLEGLR